MAANDVPVILVGTKRDLRDAAAVTTVCCTGSTTAGEHVSNYGLQPRQRQVAYAQGLAMAGEIGAAKYIECSALATKSIGLVFENAVAEVLSQRLAGKSRIAICHII